MAKKPTPGDFGKKPVPGRVQPLAGERPGPKADGGATTAKVSAKRAPPSRRV